MTSSTVITIAFAALCFTVVIVLLQEVLNAED